MPDFVVFGIDVLDQPQVNSLSGAGNEGQGTVTITGGTQPFEDDDIVVFSAIRLTAEGEIPRGGAIDDLTVYDSRADYEAGIVKYNYRPQNPGQTANIQGSLSGLGDGYVNFNSGVLIPEDGGPAVPRLFVAPGTNLADAAAQPGGVTLDRNQDIDFNGDGDFDDPIEDGNNLFYVGDYTAPVPCFTAGTRILTPTGEIAIETLTPGDRVITFDSGTQVVRWVGRRKLRAVGHMAPVHISKDTFGHHDSLLVSQNHRILRTGPAIRPLFDTPEVLVAAKYLVDNRNVTIRRGGWVDYVHILFDQHHLVWANGCLSESLFPASITADPELAPQLEELRAIFPEVFDGTALKDLQTVRPCLKRFEAQLLR